MGIQIGAVALVTSADLQWEAGGIYGWKNKKETFICHRNFAGDGGLRFSVGLEDVDGIGQDLAFALGKVYSFLLANQNIQPT